ncbi:MAG: MBL fold metallo-hydrolase, partial [Pseudomonadota bacterium]
DPGPMDTAHEAAILAALPDGGHVTAILVTHAHLDHSALAPALAARLEAPVMAMGTAAVRDPTLGGGEGVDWAFKPDRQISDGDVIAGDGWHLTALHTPGHKSDHMAFVWGEGRAIFTGDHVMGWSTSFVSPPDGDMAAYMASLERLEAKPEAVYLPGHGDPVPDGPARVRALRAHRQAREAAILAALSEPLTLEALTAVVYADTDPSLHGAASRNLLGHLLQLIDAGLVDAPAATGPYRRRQ